MCIAVPKKQAETTLSSAYRLELVDKTLEIQRDEDYVYIPLADQPSDEKLKSVRENAPRLELAVRVFKEKEHPASLEELLKDRLPPHMLSALPRAADFVGDIAIVELRPGLEDYKKTVGEAILKAIPRIRTVLAKEGAVAGTYRLRKFSLAAGEPGTETRHREYGCEFLVDVAKAYFSPRLAHEHDRVASLVREGETVVDLFAGVGPFAIQIAKKHDAVKVYAVDVNPEAEEYLKRNIRLNRVNGKVSAILGDARQVAKERLSGVADRVIMNLPEKAFEYVDAACETLKNTGGTLHVYTFVKASESFEDVRNRLTDAVTSCGRRVDGFLFSGRVRETAPHEFQAVFDVKVSGSDG